MTGQPRNPHWRDRLSTIDLLALTSLDQLLWYWKHQSFISYKTSYLHEEVNRTESFPSVSVPWFSIQSIHLWNIPLWPQIDSNISSGSGKDSLHGDYTIRPLTFVNYPLDSSAAVYSQNFIKYVLLKVHNIVIQKIVRVFLHLNFITFSEKISQEIFS